MRTRLKKWMCKVMAFAMMFALLLDTSGAAVIADTPRNVDFSNVGGPSDQKIDIVVNLDVEDLRVQIAGILGCAPHDQRVTELLNDVLMDAIGDELRAIGWGDRAINNVFGSFEFNPTAVISSGRETIGTPNTSTDTQDLGTDTGPENTLGVPSTSAGSMAPYSTTLDGFKIDTSKLDNWVVYDNYDTGYWGGTSNFTPPTGAVDGSTWRERFTPTGVLPQITGAQGTDRPFFTHARAAGGTFGSNLSNNNTPRVTLENWLANPIVGRGAHADAAAPTLGAFDRHILEGMEGSPPRPKMDFVGYYNSRYTDWAFFPVDSTTSGVPAGIRNNKKTVSFDVDGSKVNAHSLFGAGFLINAGVTGPTSAERINGYVIYYIYPEYDYGFRGNLANFGNGGTTNNHVVGNVPPTHVVVYQLRNDITPLQFHQHGNTNNSTYGNGSATAANGRNALGRNLIFTGTGTGNISQITNNPPGTTGNNGDWRFQPGTNGLNQWSGPDFQALFANGGNPIAYASLNTYQNLSNLRHSNAPNWWQQMSIRLEFDQDTLRMYQGPLNGSLNPLAFTTTSATGATVATGVTTLNLPTRTNLNGFGPAVSYRSHGCARATSFTFSNLQMDIEGGMTDIKVLADVNSRIDTTTRVDTERSVTTTTTVQTDTDEKLEIFLDNDSLYERLKQVYDTPKLNRTAGGTRYFIDLTDNDFGRTDLDETTPIGAIIEKTDSSVTTTTMLRDLAVTPVTYSSKTEYILSLKERHVSGCIRTDCIGLCNDTEPPLCGRMCNQNCRDCTNPSHIKVCDNIACGGTCNKVWTLADIVTEKGGAIYSHPDLGVDVVRIAPGIFTKTGEGMTTHETETRIRTDKTVTRISLSNNLESKYGYSEIKECLNTCTGTTTCTRGLAVTSNPSDDQLGQRHLYLYTPHNATNYTDKPATDGELLSDPTIADALDSALGGLDITAVNVTKPAADFMKTNNIFYMTNRRNTFLNDGDPDGPEQIGIDVVAEGNAPLMQNGKTVLTKLVLPDDPTPATEAELIRALQNLFGDKFSEMGRYIADRLPFCIDGLNYLGNEVIVFGYNPAQILQLYGTNPANHPAKLMYPAGHELAEQPLPQNMAALVPADAPPDPGEPPAAPTSPEDPEDPDHNAGQWETYKTALEQYEKALEAYNDAVDAVLTAWNATAVFNPFHPNYGPTLDPNFDPDFETNVELNLTQEAVLFFGDLTDVSGNPTFKIEAFSVQLPGRPAKWRNVKPGVDFNGRLLPRLLNKGGIIEIANEAIFRERAVKGSPNHAQIVALNRAKAPNPDTATIIRFAGVQARPRGGPKFAINYAVYGDNTGATTGEWVLTDKSCMKKADVSTMIPLKRDDKNNPIFMIAIADPASKGRLPGDRGWGAFCANPNAHSDGNDVNHYCSSDNRVIPGHGIPVQQLTGPKPEKIAYLVRLAPVIDTAASTTNGVTYTPAGRQRRVAALQELKPTNYKIRAVKPKENKRLGEITIPGNSILRFRRGDLFFAGNGAGYDNNGLGASPASFAAGDTAFAALQTAYMTDRRAFLEAFRKWQEYEALTDKEGVEVVTEPAALGPIPSFFTPGEVFVVDGAKGGTLPLLRTVDAEGRKLERISEHVTVWRAATAKRPATQKQVIPIPNPT
jgi:hypothetical protein